MRIFLHTGSVEIHERVQTQLSMDQLLVIRDAALAGSVRAYVVVSIEAAMFTVDVKDIDIKRTLLELERAKAA